jgi:hypothetical protein
MDDITHARSKRQLQTTLLRLAKGVSEIPDLRLPGFRRVAAPECLRAASGAVSELVEA